jgi:hypothetical protein
MYNHSPFTVLPLVMAADETFPFFDDSHEKEVPVKTSNFVLLMIEFL